jgi:hypothetical protein
MAKDQLPVVSQWYRHLDKGQQFQVTAIDEDEGAVDIQHFDGDVEELDLDSWREFDIEAIEPPEDWTGPMDDVERDDLGYSDTGMTGADWGRPLSEAVGRTEEEPGEGREE